MEANGDTTSGANGTIFLTGFLRASFILLRGSYAHGQCNHAERMATIRAIEYHPCRDVDHGKDVLKERGEKRTSRETAPCRIEQGNKACQR
jgi:hypothetical protein